MEKYIFIDETKNGADLLKSNFAAKLKPGSAEVRLISCSVEEVNRLAGVHPLAAVFVHHKCQLDDQAGATLDALITSEETPICFVDTDLQAVDPEIDEPTTEDPAPEAPALVVEPAHIEPPVVVEPTTEDPS